MIEELTRRYLVPVRPLHLETLESYTHRLLVANHETDMHQRHLVRLAESDGWSGTPQETWSRIVELKTGRPTTRLTPSLTPSRAHPDGTECPSCTAGITERFLCRLCARGESVKQHAHFDGNVCLRHQRWVGPHTTSDQQVTVDDELVAAELVFRKLNRRGLISPASYFALHRILSPITRVANLWGVTADTHLYPALIRLAELITSEAFCRRLFNPNRTFAQAFAYLAVEVTQCLGYEHRGITRSLWLYLRPTFLNIRESLDRGKPFETASVHDFPLRPTVVDSFEPPIRPLEPFTRYLDPTGDQVATSANALDVLVHYGATTAITKRVLLPTICRDGHRTDRNGTQLKKRAASGEERCGVCHHDILLRGYNDMATTHPPLAREFDEVANFPLTSRDVFAGSPTRFWWKCPTVANHRFEATASNRSAAHSGCPLCLGRLIVANVNDAESLYPHLAREFHPTKNGRFKLSELAANSPQLIWWICPSNHTYRKTVRKRTGGAGCHHCERKTSGARTITRARPDLAPEWDYVQNFPRTPDEVTIGSMTEYRWVCPAGHPYPQRPERRAAGYGCPSCSHRRFTPNVNDAETLHPEICTEWHPYLNMIKPSEIMPGTKSYVWLCKIAKHLEKQSIPHRVLSGGCTKCTPEVRVRGKRPAANQG
jgi:hypothetical protein